MMPEARERVMFGRSKTMSAPEIRKALRERDFSALKRFGQNFLTDERVLAKICDAALDEIRIGGRAQKLELRNVFEVGPGLGALTGILLSRGRKVRAFEIDRGFCALLREEYGRSGLEVVEGDCLKTLFEEKEAPDILCGNLPYNIGTILVARILEAGLNGFFPPRMAFLMQREVAEKFCAREGDAAFCSLSVLTRLSYDCSKAFDVPAGSFFPVPKVISSLVVFERVEPLVPDADKRAFIAKFVRSCFANRRKTLRNNLLRFGLSDPDSALTKAGIDPLARAEQLTVADFLKLGDAAMEDFPFLP